MNTLHVQDEWDEHSAEWLAEQKDLDVVTQGNVGGAGGFFTGMKYAVEKGYDYVWAMDDDVLCRHDALAELMKAMALLKTKK